MTSTIAKRCRALFSQASKLPISAPHINLIQSTSLSIPSFLAWRSPLGWPVQSLQFVSVLVAFSPAGHNLSAARSIRSGATLGAGSDAFTPTTTSGGTSPSDLKPVRIQGRVPASVPLIKEGLQPDAPPLSVHDPCVFRAQDGQFYMFGTGQPPGVSGDAQVPYWRASPTSLANWEYLGAALLSRPDSAKNINWARAPNANTTFWAPEVAFFNNRYYLYYAYSSFGSNNSAIGLVSTESLDSKPIQWRDEGLVVQSPSKAGNFNAIDPGVLIDAQGHLWLSWGSFWGGIFMGELDPRTGRLLNEKAKAVIIAARPDVKNNPIEGATLVHRKANNAYYAFIAWDYCCPAPGKQVFEDHPYRIVVGKSSAGPLGPYFDQGGQLLVKGGGTPLLMRDAATNAPLPTVPGPENARAGPGSCFLETIPRALASAADGFTAAGSEVGTRFWKGIGGPSVILDQPDSPDVIAVHSYPSGQYPARCRIFELGWDGDWPFMKWVSGIVEPRAQI